MFSWYKRQQGAAHDLNKVAKTIQEQNPYCMQWASNRFREFYEIASRDNNLIPSASPNGFDWNGDHSDNENNLLYFDQVFLNEHEEEISTTLSISLQIDGGESKSCRIVLRLSIDDDSDNPNVGGLLELRGQTGCSWDLYQHISAEAAYQDQLTNFFRWMQWPDEYANICTTSVGAKDVRRIFNQMIELHTQGF